MGVLRRGGRGWRVGVLRTGGRGWRVGVLRRWEGLEGGSTADGGRRWRVGVRACSFVQNVKRFIVPTSVICMHHPLVPVRCGAHPTVRVLTLR